MKNNNIENNSQKQNENTGCVGRIYAVWKNLFEIGFEGKRLMGCLKGSYFMENEEPPVVGDFVDFTYNPCGESMISGIRERKSMLKRPDQSGHAIGYVKTMQEQVMVANFDYVFIVASLNDNYNFNRIARIVIMIQSLAAPSEMLLRLVFYHRNVMICIADYKGRVNILPK